MEVAQPTADHFVFLSESRPALLNLLPAISDCLRVELALELHPRKVSLSTVASGIDFLGWVHFPHHRVIRTKTKRRLLNKLRNGAELDAIRSYLGLLQYGDAYGVRVEVENSQWLISEPGIQSLEQELEQG